MMQKLPIGIQTFSEIIKEDYLYIDKTEAIHRLIEIGKYFFLSRPRRFGKSLLLSTIKSVFRGDKELFTGLYIYDRINWQAYPVVHIDFSTINYSDGIAIFKAGLIRCMREIARDHGIDDLVTDNYKECFSELIRRLHNVGGRVVVLVDEYDKPIIDHLTDRATASANRDILRNFYSVLKGCDEYLRFVFFTGVSKFAKVSVFSGLNNLTDITIDNRFSTIAGVTQEELENNFTDFLDKLQGRESCSRDELQNKINYWYNGYSWDGESRLYNPFSLLNLLATGEFGNYWFSTGTPTFLIEMIKEKRESVDNFEDKAVGAKVFESFDIGNPGVTSLLFQTGYLTIRNVIRSGQRPIYHLSYPNYEVRTSLFESVLAHFVELEPGALEPLIESMRMDLRAGRLEDFMGSIRSLFAGIPSSLYIQKEAYYHSLFYMLLSLLGAKVDLEQPTNKGRIDAVLELGETVYIIEFKMDSAAKAVQQIKDRKYHEKFLKRAKVIKLLGVGGFRDKRINYEIEELS